MSKTIIKKKKIEPINKNKALLEAKINTFIENGRVEITTIDELKEYPIGALISYMNTSKIFKSAGVLIKIGDDYFIYLNLETDQKFKVWMANVYKMWVGKVYKVKNDLVSLIKSDKKETSNPVIIGNIPIYYAKDGYDRKRFCCTLKHKLAQKWYELFGEANE